MGPVLAIMHGIFPFWQCFGSRHRPDAGNVALLKHARTFRNAPWRLRYFQRAGFPTAVFQTLLIETKRCRPSSKIRA